MVIASLELAWLLVGPPGASAPEPPTTLERSAANLREARDALSEDGLDLQLFITADATVAARGRVQPGTWVGRALVDATATLDGEKVIGWRGGTVHLGLQGLLGQRGDRLFGDVQTYDNLDTAPFASLSELWVQQTLAGDRIRIKLGRIEANAEFATVEQTALATSIRARRSQIHSSPGFSPTMVRLPSYPSQSMGVVAEAKPLRAMRVVAGVFDATHFPALLSSQTRPSNEPPLSTLLLIGEAEVDWRLGAERRAGRLAAGGWGLLGPEACAEPPCARSATGGVFALATQTLWRQIDAARGVAAYAQYGWAPPAASSIRHHAGGGAALTPVAASRPLDELGGGVSWVGLEGDLAGETAIEVFYRAAVQQYVWLQPDVQYIVDPAGTEPDGVAITLRIAVDL